MKKEKILLIVGITLVVLGVLFLPKRIKLYNAIKESGVELVATGEMFQDYDVTDSSLVEVEGDYFTISVPKDFVRSESNAVIGYKSHDETENVMWNKRVSDGDLDFFSSDYDESEIFGIKYKMDDLRVGFNRLGYGIPDCTYNTTKNIYLLREEDYSFWDYEKGLAYANAAYLNSGIMNEEDHYYIYEREDLYATILEYSPVKYPEISIFYIDVYNPNNLSESFFIAIRLRDRQQVYAVINSIKLK